MSAQSYARYQTKDSSVECFVKYLKEQSINDEFFNSVAPFRGSTGACHNGVEAEKEFLFAYAHSTSMDCVKAEMQTDEWYRNLLLKKRTLKSIDEGTMRQFGNMFSNKKSKKQIAVENVDKELSSLTSVVAIKCNLRFEFSQLFDSFFVRDSDEDAFVPYEDVQEYCIKKELSDKRLINLQQFNTKLNPKSLRVETLDCREIIQPLKTEIIESLRFFDLVKVSVADKKCIFKTLKDGSEYFHLLLKAELLTKLQFNSSQKQEEKKNFVEKMIEVTLKIRSNCRNSQKLI